MVTHYFLLLAYLHLSHLATGYNTPLLDLHRLAQHIREESFGRNNSDGPYLCHNLQIGMQTTAGLMYVLWKVQTYHTLGTPSFSTEGSTQVERHTVFLKVCLDTFDKANAGTLDP